MYKLISLLLLILMTRPGLQANGPVWRGKGRIIISCDGNEHDNDDLAATPLSPALLAAAGLQDRLVVYTFSDHIWGSNQNHFTRDSYKSAYLQMRESALGGKKWFGFVHTNFICAVDNAEVAYRSVMDEINKSTAEDPVFILAAGPMRVVGESIARSEKDKRQYVTLISHSEWNNNHADHPCDGYRDVHSGWTFREIWQEFSGSDGGGLSCVRILDQNEEMIIRDLKPESRPMTG